VSSRTHGHGGVFPSLCIVYKSSRVEQHFKEGQALRRETIINDTYDFGIDRQLENFPTYWSLAAPPPDVFWTSSQPWLPYWAGPVSRSDIAVSGSRPTSFGLILR